MCPLESYFEVNSRQSFYSIAAVELHLPLMDFQATNRMPAVILKGWTLKNQYGNVIKITAQVIRCMSLSISN